jgi:hypothetical protein
MDPLTNRTDPSQNPMLTPPGAQLKELESIKFDFDKTATGSLLFSNIKFDDKAVTSVVKALPTKRGLFRSG